MKTDKFRNFICLLAWITSYCLAPPKAISQEIVGLQVVPHQFSNQLQWRRAPDPELGARVDLFIKNKSTETITLPKESIAFDGQSPRELLEANKWTWHHSPDSWSTANDGTVELPPASLTVLSFNGRGNDWGVGTLHAVTFAQQDSKRLEFDIQEPPVVVSAVSFHSVDESFAFADSNTMMAIVHVANDSYADVRVEDCRLWLPRSNATYQTMSASPQKPTLVGFSSDGVIPAGTRGGFTMVCDALPLSYVAMELLVSNVQQPEKRFSVWTNVRVRQAAFDISGGWIASDIQGTNSLQIEEYLLTLKRMHINSGQIEEVGGFTDNANLYAKFPFKRFNRMADMQRYSSPQMLKEIHAVEFLGEPQYGGGRPVPPQEVYDSLMPYRATKLPTTVTLSEERTWRYYAGLSDFVHYDAYRVIAPAADAWNKYDRWNGQKIRWGAPLETIGDMTRSLRELSRPNPIAYWSQGAHDGWGGFLSARRTSPTPDELRSQAWQGIGNGIASLYWFNLSLKSLCKFPDLIDPITRVNREIRLLDDLLLESDTFEYRRVDAQGTPSWDLSSIAGPNALIMVANDIAYTADLEAREFKFERRQAKLEFQVPSWLESDALCFRIDADGPHDVSFTRQGSSIVIEDEIYVVGVYVLSNKPDLRETLAGRHARLRRIEADTRFDPASNPDDLAKLKSFLMPKNEGKEDAK